MANIKAVPLSELPVIKEPDSFFVFASKTDENGVMESGRVMFDELKEMVRRLQLERRISLTMESTETEMFIGEEMTIYRVEAYNVKEFRVNTKAVAIGKDVNVLIPKSTLATFSITRSGTDPKGYLFIYAKAKLL